MDRLDKNIRNGVNSFRVLLADREYSQYLLLRSLLCSGDQNDIEVFWCGEPDQYLPAIESDIYDLVFVNCDMQSLMILEMLERRLERTPVVVLTDECIEEVASRVMEYGAFAVVQRSDPDPDVLLTLIQQLRLNNRLSLPLLPTTLAGASV